MTLVPNAYFRIYLRIRRSIVFVPSVISTLFLCAALLINTVEHSELVSHFKLKIAFALVTDVETARTVLAILIGGMISLTVFSFSMVMLSINQASATFSPSVVPALIADPFRQRILGIYLGTIIFYLILTLNINAAESQYPVPQLGILLSYVLAILCLTLFVHFISSISRALQVDTILQDLFDQTIHQIKSRTERQQEVSSGIDDNRTVPDDSNWYMVRTIFPGYFKSINEEQLRELMNEYDFSANVKLQRGEFSVVGQPLVMISKELSTEMQEKLAGCFVFYIEEFAQEHYSFGLKQIAQIGAKALSPGINDPMTAIKCIQLLSLIFVEALRLEEFEYIKTKETENICYIPEYSLKKLVFITLNPLSKYAEKDAQTLIAIVNCYKDIIASAKNDNTVAELAKAAGCLADEIDRNITNQTEREQLNGCFKATNQFIDTPIQQISLLTDQ